MISIPMEDEFDIPKWDVALEALMREEFTNNGKSFKLSDIMHLADEYSIRFDDLMVTALELVVHGEWQYCHSSGEKHAITQKEIDQLYRGGRIHENDVQHYNGCWIPLDAKQ